MFPTNSDEDVKLILDHLDIFPEYRDKEFVFNQNETFKNNKCKTKHPFKTPCTINEAIK